MILGCPSKRVDIVRILPCICGISQIVLIYNCKSCKLSQTLSGLVCSPVQPHRTEPWLLGLLHFNSVSVVAERLMGGYLSNSEMARNHHLWFLKAVSFLTYNRSLLAQ